MNRNHFRRTLFIRSNLQFEEIYSLNSNPLSWNNIGKGPCFAKLKLNVCASKVHWLFSNIASSHNTLSITRSAKLNDNNFFCDFMDRIFKAFSMNSLLNSLSCIRHVYMILFFSIAELKSEILFKLNAQLIWLKIYSKIVQKENFVQCIDTRNTSKFRKIKLLFQINFFVLQWLQFKNI